MLKSPSSATDSHRGHFPRLEKSSLSYELKLPLLWLGDGGGWGGELYHSKESFPSTLTSPIILCGQQSPQVEGAAAHDGLSHHGQRKYHQATPCYPER